MQAATQTWNPAHLATGRWYARLMPGLTDLVFLLPALLLFARLSGTKTLLADGDTGWHIRTGDWIWQHRAVPAEDLFSFTKPHQPWFAWEWGWDVLFSAVHRAWGLGGVAFVNVLLLGFTAVLLYRLVLRASDNFILSAAVTVFAMCGTAIHWLARPHLVSWIFFLTFLHLLRTAEEGTIKVLFWLPALTVLWVNLHAAFFAGMLLILTCAAGRAAETFWVQRQPGRSAVNSARPYLLSAAGCLAASFVNPYGWRLHRHILAYVTDAKLLDNIQEYQSISFHCGPALFFEAMLLLAAVSVFWSLQRGRAAPAIAILGWAHLALLSARNIPLFMMVAAPGVAGLLQHLLVSFRNAPGVGPFFTTVSDICDEIRPLEQVKRLHLVSISAVLAMAVLFAAGASGFEGQFNRDSFPAQAMEIVEASPARRVFTYDQWGDYLIYRLYPARKVFFDGRSDFYGSAFVTSNQQILAARYDWQAQLDRFAVDMVIVKPDTPLSTVLKSASGWRVLFDDGKVLVFQTEPRRREASAAGQFGARDSRVAPATHFQTPRPAAAQPIFLTSNYERRNLYDQPGIQSVPD